MNDMKLCQLGWVYDLNFAASLERLKQRGYIDELFSLLPQTPEIAKAAEKIHGFMDAKLGRIPQPKQLSEA